MRYLSVLMVLLLLSSCVGDSTEEIAARKKLHNDFWLSTHKIVGNLLITSCAIDNGEEDGAFSDLIFEPTNILPKARKRKENYIKHREECINLGNNNAAICEQLIAHYGWPIVREEYNRCISEKNNKDLCYEQELQSRFYLIKSKQKSSLNKEEYCKIFEIE